MTETGFHPLHGFMDRFSFLATIVLSQLLLTFLYFVFLLFSKSLLISYLKDKP